MQSGLEQGCGESCVLLSLLHRTRKDIDKEFRRNSHKRPTGWEDTLKIANEVLIDEMRTLLESSPQRRMHID